MFFRAPAPASAGVTRVALPPGADAFSFAFEVAASPSSPVRLERDLSFSSQPPNLDFILPLIDIPSLSYDTPTGTLAWTLAGPDVARLDLARAELAYTDGSGNDIRWALIFDPTLTSIKAPDLPSSLLNLMPSAPGLSSYALDVRGADTVNGFDSYVAATQPFMGNFDQFAIGAVTDTFLAEHKVHSLTFSIGGSANGLVTVDSGSGPVAVNDGDVLELSEGAVVTVDASTSPPPT